MKFFIDSLFEAQEGKVFGERVQAFRKASDLTQQDFADFMGTDKSYISKLENGSVNPSLDMMVKYAAFFGVKHYELSNPRFPVPNYESLPAKVRKEIVKIKKQRDTLKTKVAEHKASLKEDGVPGRAKQLHKLIDSGFFKRSRTAKEAFAKLFPAVKKADYHLYAEEQNRIMTTLSRGRFAKLLDKLEPAPGTTAVRFVQKDPSVANYLDGPVGHQDIAADGE